MIQLMLDQLHDRKYWRFTRYNSAGETSLVGNQIMPYSMHVFRNSVGRGMIIGTDHGKECWYNGEVVAVYDLHWMLDIARANVESQQRDRITFDTLENFEPEPIDWLKCADHELVVDLMCKHQEWFCSIPKIVIQRRNQWSKCKISSWDRLFDRDAVFKIANNHLCVLEKEIDYAKEEGQEKGLKP